MKIIKSINIALAFFLEIAMLVAFGYFGFHYSQNTVMKYMLMITLPLIAMVLWGYFSAPKSKHRLQQPSRVVFVLTVFGAAIFFLNMTGETLLAAVFAIIVIINQLMLFILKQ
ncbi:MAG: YrdB family protein [Ginsengibacter sp.]